MVSAWQACSDKRRAFSRAQRLFTVPDRLPMIVSEEGMICKNFSSVLVQIKTWWLAGWQQRAAASVTRLLAPQST